MKSHIGESSASARRDMTIRLFGVLLLVSALAGFGPPSAVAATGSAPSMPAWQQAISKLQVPGQGCFRASYPAIRWQASTCSSVHPKTPQRFGGPEPSRQASGGAPQQVGGPASDYVAVTTSPTTEADGSFPSVTCTASPGCQVTETGLYGNQGTAASNVYSIQLNSNDDLPAPPGCSSAADPSACVGWQQFVYDSKLKIIQVQPALIGYENACPGAFNTPDSSGNCYDENENSANVPLLTPEELSSDSVKLVGQANSVTDTVKLIVSGQGYAATASDKTVNLAGNWIATQFGVYGDAGGGEAHFSAGTDLKVSVATHSGTTAAPLCLLESSYTAESNNLFLQPAPTLGTQPGPTMETDQNSSQPTSPAACAAAHGIGDTHLETFNKLLYDYQAQGDYDLVTTGAPPPARAPGPAQAPGRAHASGPAQAPSPAASASAPRFTVQERQVSGAPSWPNASVNKAVAAQVGSSDVAVCTAPTRLEIDGSTVSLASGTRRVLPDGASVTVNGNVYLIRDGSGNTVQATVQSGSTPHVDVAVGLGKWPEPVQGLAANAGNSDNAIESRGGAVFTAPFAFGQLYGAYGRSWLLPKDQDLLSACNGRTDGVVSRNPAQPFYADNLPGRIRASARAACVTAGVRSAALLDACTIDVAVLGRQAVAVYRTLPAPAVWGVARARCRKAEWP